MARLFVAVPISSPELAGRLADAGRRAAEGFHAKRVLAEQLHVTLKFLGEVADGNIEAAAGAVRVAARAASPFELELHGLGAFPPRGSPRVLWAGCGAGRDALRALVALVEEAFASAGFEREARPFSAHLTLARLREGGAARDLRERIERDAATAFGVVPVTAAVLYRSVLTSAGAAHTRLAAAPLGEVGL